MKTPILGSSYVARSKNAADSRMVNLFPEIVPEMGKEPAFLNRAPGLNYITSVGAGPVRGIWSFGGYLYVVSGAALYKINSVWNAVLVGEVLGSGTVSMADNGIQLFIATNPIGYIYNSQTNEFKSITDPDFPGAVTVGYIDGYFVFNEPNSQKIWVTALLDGNSIDPLDFASAEGNPDNLISLIVDHGEIWLFGTNSTEVWYDAGAIDFPLARIQGAFNEIGCIAPYSVAKMDNTIFWLGADARGYGIVYKANGYRGQRVSTHAIEWQIQQYSNLSQAIGYTYQQEGHTFYMLVFPGTNTTWVYDAATEAWHERASWVNGEWNRHRSNCQTAFNNLNVVGDYENGNIYSFDTMLYADNGQIQRWLRSWRALPTGQNDLKRTAQHSLQLDCESGIGLEVYPYRPEEPLITELGDIIITEFDQIYLTSELGDFLVTEDGSYIVEIDYPEPYPIGFELSTEPQMETPGYVPKVMLRWSDDGGHTWSSEHWQSMGKLGNYGQRVIWRRLGMTQKLRDRVYEISGTDPIKIDVMGAELLLSGTNA